MLKTTLLSTEKITLAFSVSPFNLRTPRKSQNGQKEEKLAFLPRPTMKPSRVPAAPFNRKVLSCAEIRTQKMGKRKNYQISANDGDRGTEGRQILTKRPVLLLPSFICFKTLNQIQTKAGASQLLLALGKPSSPACGVLQLRRGKIQARRTPTAHGPQGSCWARAPTPWRGRSSSSQVHAGLLLPQSSPLGPPRPRARRREQK